jgi:alkylhydroperoxidase family enzyme
MASQTILDVGVRDDLAAAHATTFADLSRPGDWLRADERAAIVRVVRAARNGSDQPPWYRPSADHNHFDPLSDAAVDAAWRLTNHPGTLTKDWYTSTVEGLPSPEYYVELVGIVAIVNAIDRLATLLDLELIPIPDPAPGEPTRQAIPSEVTSHWVPTVLDFEGANVLRASTVAPTIAEMRTRIGATHYLPAEGRSDMDWSRGDLDRRQIELIAAVTSRHNDCFY